MTTLYRPVLIESVEQAEALPVGTIAYRKTRDEVGPLVAVQRYDREERERYWLMVGEQFGYATPHMLSWGGWTALVPIEAEEETE